MRSDGLPKLQLRESLDCAQRVRNVRGIGITIRRVNRELVNAITFRQAATSVPYPPEEGEFGGKSEYKKPLSPLARYGPRERDNHKLIAC
jgi:hypothetical protein